MMFLYWQAVIVTALYIHGSQSQDPGPIGPTGSTGATGQLGGTGYTGPVGPTGPRGDGNGGVGSTGATGQRGFPGNTGRIGATGIRGLDAESSGSTGSTGLTGRTGSTGATGATGDRGPSLGGPTSTGATGATGYMGNSGYTGATGRSGVSGLVGPIGPSGRRGEAGPAGPQGPVITCTEDMANRPECQDLPEATIDGRKSAVAAMYKRWEHLPWARHMLNPHLLAAMLSWLIVLSFSIIVAVAVGSCCQGNNNPTSLSMANAYEQAAATRMGHSYEEMSAGLKVNGIYPTLTHM